MWVHLADTSHDRGQYGLLLEQRYLSTLLSYAYPRIEAHFAKYWSAMHLHLAGIAAIKPERIYPGVTKRLDSFAYPDEAEKFMQMHLAGHPTLTGGQVRTEDVYSEPAMRKRLETAAYPDRAEASVAALTTATERTMHLHVAGQPNQRAVTAQVLPSVGKRLETHAYPQEAERNAQVAPPGCRVLIDSGAFTAFTLGKKITPEDYAEWALAFRSRWERKLAWLKFFNLDVIGDQDASWRNQATLERLGLPVIPIVTQGAPLRHIERALAEYDYFALGGLVPLTRQRAKLQAWLDQCFAPVVKKFRATGNMTRVHLLGVTQDWVLDRYPAYSADSSSWVAVLRYGGTGALGKGGPQKVPHAKTHPEINVFALRHEIRRYVEMEQKATTLWAQRGVRWED